MWFSGLELVGDITFGIFTLGPFAASVELAEFGFFTGDEPELGAAGWAGFLGAGTLDIILVDSEVVGGVEGEVGAELFLFMD